MTQPNTNRDRSISQAQARDEASNDRSFNKEQQQRIASFEAPVKIDYNAAVPVPRIDNQLITTNGEPENEALKRLLLDPPRDPNQLRGQRFIILATDGVEELELTVPYKFIQERGGTLHLVAPRYQPRQTRLGSAYPEKQRQTHIMTVRWMDNSGWFAVDRWLSDVKVNDYDDRSRWCLEPGLTPHQPRRLAVRPRLLPKWQTHDLDLSWSVGTSKRWGA